MRSIRMANDHTRNALSRSLRPRADVASRSIGAALRPDADDVAPTQAGISLGRGPVRKGSREAGRRVERANHHLVHRDPSPAPIGHEATRRT
jgi:hypothetical protein